MLEITYTTFHQTASSETNEIQANELIFVTPTAMFDIEGGW